MIFEIAKCVLIFFRIHLNYFLRTELLSKIKHILCLNSGINKKI